MLKASQHYIELIRRPDETLFNILGDHMKRYLISIYLLLSACTGLPPAFDNAPATEVSYNQAREDLGIITIRRCVGVASLLA